MTRVVIVLAVLLAAVPSFAQRPLSRYSRVSPYQRAVYEGGYAAPVYGASPWRYPSPYYGRAYRYSSLYYALPSPESQQLIWAVEDVGFELRWQRFNQDGWRRP